MKNKRELKHFLQTLAIVVIGVVLYWGLANYKVVEHWLALLFGVLSPFIIGFVLALMLNVPMSFIERNLFRPKKDGSRGKLSAKIARPVSLALTYVICAGVIVLVMALIVPSVKETVVQLSEQVPDFVVRVFNKASNNAALNSWINKAGLSADKVIATLTDKLHNSTIISDALTGTINFATDMVSSMVNFFIGLVFSVYMLARKEKLKSQLYRTCTAFLPEKAVRRLAHVGNLSKATFSNFLSGQSLEACILGSLCALGLKILGDHRRTGSGDGIYPNSRRVSRHGHRRAADTDNLVQAGDILRDIHDDPSADRGQPHLPESCGKISGSAEYVGAFRDNHRRQCRRDIRYVRSRADMLGALLPAWRRGEDMQRAAY